MTLIESTDLFYAPEANFLRDLLKSSMNPLTLQKISEPFYDGEVK